jgi:NAD(P)H-hydrate epimerase
LAAVWDADALNLLASAGGRSDRRVITPHPGEAGSLLQSSARAVQADRLAAIAALADKFGGTVVLKGAGSLVTSASSAPFICLSGNPGMAAPGMGDVLTGIIAGLMAQGLPPEQAAVVGVEAHAEAGDRAAIRGERGMIASDLLAELRGVLNP